MILEREEGRETEREKEREGETSIGCLSYVSNIDWLLGYLSAQGWNRQPRYVPSWVGGD